MKIVNPVGKKGEDLAVQYLIEKGYKILERNFRKRNGEIDIVALQNGVLVFIEVKTRTSIKYGTPFEAVTYFKLKSLMKTAELYKMSHKNLPDAMRIDAIAILLDANMHAEKIEHMENISGF